MACVRRILLIVVVFLMAACTHLSLHPQADAPDPEALQRALTGELLLNRTWRAEDMPDYALFLLTPEMQSFAEQAVAGKKNTFARAQALQRALLLSPQNGGLGLRYNAYITETPIDAFARRSVNCVSFTFMYVAMARHVGLDAYVNEVDLPPSWDLRNRDAFLFLRHVNAKVRLARKDEVVVDLEMERYSPAYRQRHISEELAAAQFYNNRGMELSATGDATDAFIYLRKALLLDDQQSYIWSNFATLYRRQGFFAEAEAAYLHGLQLDAADLTIMSNLSGLYRRTGNTEKADYYYSRAEQHRERNPYYRYSEASYALEEGQFAQALALIQQAIRGRRDEPRFYSLAAEIYEQLGNSAQAEQMRKKSERLKQPFIETR